jgi:hypothetical protein
MSTPCSVSQNFQNCSFVNELATLIHLIFPFMNPHDLCLLNPHHLHRFSHQTSIAVCSILAGCGHVVEYRQLGYTSRQSAGLKEPQILLWRKGFLKHPFECMHSVKETRDSIESNNDDAKKSHTRQPLCFVDVILRTNPVSLVWSDKSLV